MKWLMAYLLSIYAAATVCAAVEFFLLAISGHLSIDNTGHAVVGPVLLRMFFFQPLFMAVFAAPAAFLFFKIPEFFRIKPRYVAGTILGLATAVLSFSLTMTGGSFLYMYPGIFYPHDVFLELLTSGGAPYLAAGIAFGIVFSFLRRNWLS